MRMMVFFDLPTETAADRRVYRRFRNELIRNGFLMMQESVYCKLLMNTTADQAVRETIRKVRPPKGIVQILTITEKQFSKIEYLTGEFKSDIINTDERMIVL
ncbi:MAG TPA: CRISPR-associated endonuclease Cas2 [Candidatus Faecousia intestinigallinarum]|nr:CRISPR-associated endonuclease Cas2 [Candidatus Faecousia intestinigallinarum]